MSTVVRILSIVDLLSGPGLCTLDTSLYSCAFPAPLALFRCGCQYLALPDDAMNVDGNALVLRRIMENIQELENDSQLRWSRFWRCFGLQL
jgi:hypothetical protein